MIKHNLLKTKPKQLFPDFIASYAALTGVDPERASRLAQEAIWFYGGTSRYKKTGEEKGHEFANYIRDVQRRWYYSLDWGPTDFTVYTDDYYLTDLWACWKLYSRLYLLSITKQNSLSRGESIMGLFGDVRSIVDMGCGIGYSTALLTQLFPDAQVYGIDIPGTKQYVFSRAMSKTYGFKLICDLNQIQGNVDLVFASEYFEHISNAPDNIRMVIRTVEPDFMLIANSFNTRSVGHFKTYSHVGAAGKVVYCPQQKVSRKFNDSVRSCGFETIRTKLWNNKPKLWRKIT
jgi:2-polyprenyl-3-methyl-5-hydroxy-6-metoxy-1,4-benzoquinol methylase